MSLPGRGDLSSGTSADNIKAEVFLSSAVEAKGLSIGEMKAIAKRLRRHIISMTGKAGSGHPGGSLSAVEIVTALYLGCCDISPKTLSGQTGIGLS